MLDQQRLKILFTNISLNRLTEVFYWLAVSAILLFKLKTFNVLPQVIDIVGTSPTTFSQMLWAVPPSHPHFLRFILIFPAIWVADFVGIARDLVFSMLIFTLNFICYLKCSSILLLKTQSSKWNFVLLISLLLISLFMNGRIVFAFLGYVVLCSAILQKQLNLKAGLNLILAFFLLSVSSGTFLVGAVSLLLYVVLRTAKNLPVILYKDLTLIVVASVALVLLGPYIFIAIEKNLDFYDGSIYQMAFHGPGGAITKHLPLFLFLLLSVLVVLTPTYQYLLRLNLKPLLLIVFASSIIGLFGFSTFVSTFPIWLMLVVIALNGTIKQMPSEKQPKGSL